MGCRGPRRHMTCEPFHLLAERGRAVVALDLLAGARGRRPCVRSCVGRAHGAHFESGARVEQDGGFTYRCTSAGERWLLRTSRLLAVAKRMGRRARIADLMARTGDVGADTRPRRSSRGDHRESSRADGDGERESKCPHEGDPKQCSCLRSRTSSGRPASSPSRLVRLALVRRLDACATAELRRAAPEVFNERHPDPEQTRTGTVRLQRSAILGQRRGYHDRRISPECQRSEFPQRTCRQNLHREDGAAFAERATMSTNTRLRIETLLAGIAVSAVASFAGCGG